MEISISTQGLNRTSSVGWFQVMASAPPYTSPNPRTDCRFRKDENRFRLEIVLKEGEKRRSHGLDAQINQLIGDWTLTPMAVWVVDTACLK